MLSIRDLRPADIRIADGLFDGTTRRGRSDSRQNHRPVGSATEHDGLEVPPCARTIDNATYLAPELPGRACDKLQVQASSEAVLRGFLSKRDLDFFKELFPLRLWKINHQPSEAWQ